MQNETCLVGGVGLAREGSGGMFGPRPIASPWRMIPRLKKPSRPHMVVS